MNYLMGMIVFARVVESQSFTVAARQLGLTTSSVSRSVSRLETQMGAKLLSRTTRAMTLTEIGREVYGACAKIQSTARDIESLASHHAGTPRGRLRISAPVVYSQMVLMPQLTSFLAEWLEVTVDLDMTDRVVDIVGESFDLVLRIAPALPPGMVARPVDAMSYMLVASREYVESHEPLLRPEQLADRSVLCCPKAGEDARFLTMLRANELVRVDMKSRLTINNSAGRLHALEQHLDIALVPDFTAREGLRSGRVVQVLPDWEIGGDHGAMQVQAVYPPTRHVPPKVRAFIDHLVRRNRQSLAGDRPSLHGARHLESAELSAAWAVAA